MLVCRCGHIVHSLEFTTNFLCVLDINQMKFITILRDIVSATECHDSATRQWQLIWLHTCVKEKGRWFEQKVRTFQFTSDRVSNTSSHFSPHTGSFRWKIWQRSPTSEWVWCNRSRACSESNGRCLLLDEVGNLVKKHLTDVVTIKEIVCSNPRIFINVIWQLQRWLILVNLDVEYKVIVLHQKKQLVLTLWLISKSQNLKIAHILCSVHYRSEQPFQTTICAQKITTLKPATHEMSWRPILTTRVSQA